MCTHCSCYEENHTCCLCGYNEWDYEYDNYAMGWDVYDDEINDDFEWASNLDDDYIFDAEDEKLDE